LLRRVPTCKVEERSDVGVQYPVHLGAGDPNRECVERIVRPAPGPEAIREPEEVLLVDRVEHRRRSPLDDLVLQRRDGQRAPAAVHLGDEPAAGGLRPIRSPVDPLVEVLDPTIEVRLVGLPCHPVHAGSGLSLESEERHPEQLGGDVVEECSEPFLLPCPCNVPYALQPLGHAFPVLSPVRAVLARVPLGLRPSLHPLLGWHAGSVRGLPSYYGGV
jgi:hypothetical protein